MIEKILSYLEGLVPPKLVILFKQTRTHQVLAWALSFAMIAHLLLQISPSWFPANWQNPASWLPLLGVTALAGMSLYLMVVYLKQFEHELLGNIPQLYLLALLGNATLLAFWVLKSLHASPFLSPLVIEAMLLTIFISPRLAVFATLLTGLLAGYAYGIDLSALNTTMIGSLVAIFSVTQLRQRFDLGRAGLFVSLVQMVMVLAHAAIEGGNWHLWVENGAWAGIGGVTAAVISIGLLPYVEGIFGITTMFKLMELANPTHPLLRQLLLKAPGTYHHCIFVGNLGEAAAEAIGADPLLVRVGAFYHDIGKTKRPYFFIENQLGISNQHDRISPRLSTLVITSHVREGIELAREHHLPTAIQDFIAQHHGKSLVSYFYHQAMQSETPQQVQEEHFRYPGPRPKTKEVAIVMLADAVEASVRALNKPTPDTIEATVRKIVQSRLADGELAESPLTLQDIEIITATFNRIVQGLFHTRIEYPDQLLGELKQQEKRKIGNLHR